MKNIINTLFFYIPALSLIAGLYIAQNMNSGILAFFIYIYAFFVAMYYIFGTSKKNGY